MTEMTDTAARIDRAFAALQAGDAATARDLLSSLDLQPASHGRELMALASACRRLGDAEVAGRTVDRVLEAHPSNFAALLFKADVLQDRGDMQAATQYYAAALRCAPPEDRRSPALHSEVARAARMQQQMQTSIESHLRTSLRESGFVEGDATQRYEEAVDILFSRRSIYVQQPEYFYYPGLPQRQFYERAEFPWIADMEAATDAIREEAQGLLADESAFRPYLHARAGQPQAGGGPKLLNDINWSACYLIEQGRVVEDNAARCPRTMAALEHAPLCKVEGKTPNVLFSLLRPQTRIEPHNGLFNTRLICHLPLIVPDGCRLRVGNETRSWEEGRMLIFDDSIEHEAANDSDRLRVVLLFDIWRPELGDRDHDFVRAVFGAVDTFNA